MKKLLNAIHIASLGHEGQRRKYTNDSYIVHPLAVMELTNAVTHGRASEETLCAALLHDVLEDSETDPRLIKALCGENVLNLVLELTNISKPEDGNRATRKAIDRERLWSVSYEAQIIKCCDVIENSQSIARHDKDFWPVYMSECHELLLGFPIDLPGREDALATLGS